jgi:hypothetical protein
VREEGRGGEGGSMVLVFGDEANPSLERRMEREDDGWGGGEGEEYE